MRKGKGLGEITSRAKGSRSGPAAATSTGGVAELFKECCNMAVNCSSYTLVNLCCSASERKMES
ncbi:hypothetical protein AMECASPLE_036702, partial [Ameca splendens]